MPDKILYEIKEDIGFIKGKVEAIDGKQTEQGDVIKSLKKSVHRHDIALGKIGAIFTGALVLGDIAVKAIFNFFKQN